jgi:hypothetical protein
MLKAAPAFAGAVFAFKATAMMEKRPPVNATGRLDRNYPIVIKSSLEISTCAGRQPCPLRRTDRVFAFSNGRLYPGRAVRSRVANPLQG